MGDLITDISHGPFGDGLLMHETVEGSANKCYGRSRKKSSQSGCLAHLERFGSTLRTKASRRLS